MADVPHFDRPFRIVGSSAAVVEQDSDAELTNAARTILETEHGSREEMPEFGVSDLPFRDASDVSAEVLAAVRQWEPRLDAETDATIEEMTMTVAARID
jgi:phage baseplate assembly protein W